MWSVLGGNAAYFGKQLKVCFLEGNEDDVCLLYGHVTRGCIN